MKNPRLSALLFAGFLAGAGCSEGTTAFTGHKDDQHPRLNDQTPPTRLCEDACRKYPISCREADCARKCVDAVGRRCEIEALALARCVAYRGSVVCEAEERENQPPEFNPKIKGCDAEAAALELCSRIDVGEGGASGRGGASGEGGVGGDAGVGGTTGDAGTAGDAGSAGMNGASGTAGTAGMSGTGGAAGATGDASPDAEDDGSGAAGGTLGSGGTGGSAGMDASGDADQCVFPGCTGCADQCQTCLCNSPGDSGACALECAPDSGVDSGTDASAD